MRNSMRVKVAVLIFAATVGVGGLMTLLTALNAGIWWLLVVTLVLALITTGIGYRLSEGFVLPIRQLSDAAARLALGDLTTPIQIQSRNQEIRKLARLLENARHELEGTTRWLTTEKAWAEYLVDSMVEGIITLDAQNRVTFANRAAKTLLSAPAAIGQPISDLLIPADHDGHLSDLLPEPGGEVTIPVVRADGRQITLSITESRFKPPFEDRARTTIVFHDVSADTAMQRLQSYFLGNLSHELQTPLASLRTSAELLVTEHNDLSEQEHHNLHNSIYRGILRLESLIDNLLASASVQAGRFKVKAIPTDLGEPIEDAMLFMDPLLNAAGLELEIELPADLPLVCADARRVTQVLVNLLANTIKYTPPGTKVELSATIEAPMMRIKVADSGPGIPAESRDLIFSRFGRLDTPGARKDHGAGLGLYIARTIIESHGGQIGVDERPGGGSLFWFTLPLATDER